jgi:hypothetical protein
VAPVDPDIARIIVDHLPQLRAPGVLTVRPGFELSDGWLTRRQAIVVTVETGFDGSLPTEIEGVPVDVRVASATKRERVLDPRLYAGSGRVAPDTGAVPEFDSELDLTGASEASALESVSVPRALKPNLPYEPPPGASLAPVTGTFSIRLSASPDSGWPTLKPFLAATTKTLTVGLYDFTSTHILAEVESALAGKEFSLTLDHPAKNPTADQTDEQTVAALKTALGSGFDQAWALERMDPLATAWIFPTAYHIKVAVQDSSRLWLSSGNWNNSNQPDIDPVVNPGDATAARTRDRDWHVVIDDAGLATTFEAFLKNDHATAKQHNASPAAQFDAAVLQPNATTPPFAQFFAATTVTAAMTITPLLTPDAGVYTAAVKALIDGATTSLHLQFQYIELPKTASAASQAFAELVDAVIARQKAGVDVKIIMSQYETAGYLEQLQTAGLDVVTSVKLQNNVHNKGIVVDSRSVLVSSQNWSTAGTLSNRDAGVIIDNAEVAAYYDRLFQHDWDHLAAQQVAND